MPEAFAYIRVSTAEQATDGVSLEAQRTRIQAWCDANGYRLATVHTDAGISGKRADNRPALQQALTAVCERRGSALIVYSLSRLARSTKDAIAIAERLEKSGADLVSLSERIDTTTAAGKMLFRLLSVLAEFERDLISERTTAAMAVLRANGRRLSGRLPFGHDLSVDGVTLIENPAEQAVISDIRAMRAEGATLKRIAETLGEGGVRTKTGRAVWEPKTLSQILSRARDGVQAH